jgi:fructosamine-3-kinase
VTQRPDAGLSDLDAKLRLERLLDAGVRDCRGIGGQHGVRHYRATLADGRTVFAKLAGPEGSGAAAFEAGDLAPAGFEAEARGLRWLGDAGAVPVPEVLGWDAATLAMSWVPEEAPARRAAERFGRGLARLHAAGAGTFGAPWPGSIAGLPFPNDAGHSWPEWYGTHRLLPYARRARDTGSLTSADVQLIETVAAGAADLAGPPEPPSRIHGDCWSGNVLWSGGQGWLVDPAAHGGHRETDLAMLALFGAPFLGRILECYQEVTPLAAGWRDRVALHQLHPLLVHVCLFGTAYRASVLDAARSVLARLP